MKRIVCDIDDTISFTTNRDWENAIPNQEVIDKINSLYDQGWEIYLVTARGSLSCKTRQEAEEKYRNQIIKWLAKHGVKFTVLSFDKYLAAYYVDDKALTPEEFVKLDIRELKSGWSGARVELRDGRVFKTADNSIDAAAWYNIAEHFFNTPKIHSLIGNTLCMDYIKSDDTPLKMSDVISIICDMTNIPFVPGPNSNSDIRNYGDRLLNHWKTMTSWYHDFCTKENIIDFGDGFEDDMDIIIPELGQIVKDIKECISAPWTHLNKTTSFCHGDFSVDNIIIANGVPVLIDPIYEPNKPTWSSWMLDASKMLHSLRRYGRMTEYQYLLNNVALIIDIPGMESMQQCKNALRYLEITQFLRVFKYAPDREKAGIIKHIKQCLIEIGRL